MLPTAPRTVGNPAHPRFATRKMARAAHRPPTPALTLFPNEIRPIFHVHVWTAYLITISGPIVAFGSAVDIHGT
jgi:hypothetical protein